MEKQYRRIAETEKQSLKPQLENIWKRCFSDTEEGRKFVFDSIYPASRCFCCFCGDVCSAALYLIDGEIKDENGIFRKAHYLFGAATLPEYRKSGIMSSLIEYALSESMKEGDKASILLPANEGLYSYYEKLGYTPLYGTSTEEFLIPESAKASRRHGFMADGCRGMVYILEKIKEHINTPVNAMCFSEIDTDNALIYNSVYGGETMFLEDFFAVVSAPVNDEALVYEIFANEENYVEGINIIGAHLGCKKITARIPRRSTEKFGMINVLDNSVNFSDDIYIGLTKD